MKKMGQFLLFVSALIILFGVPAGCGSKEEAAQAAKPVMAPSPAAVAPETPLPAQEPAAVGKKAEAAGVVVEVEGSRLSQGEVDEEIRKKMEMFGGQIPPDRTEMAKAEIRKGVVDSFIMRTLLNREIGNRKIAVSDKEIAAVVTEITSQLPAGMSLADFLKSNGMDESRMREEIGLNLRVKKLIEQELRAKGRATDREISEFYQKNQGQFTKPESIRVRHLLVAAAPGDGEKLRAEKRSRAEEYRKQLLAGAKFTDLAAQHSDCPSKQNGGDLGFFSRGQMVKPFEDAAFSQKKDEIGAVVETEFGFHILQVIEQRKEEVAKLDGEMKKGIGAHLEQQKQQAAFEALMKKLKKNANIVVYGK
jgi:peptidyl-prolyl cis-trans isomerase C